MGQTQLKASMKEELPSYYWTQNDRRIPLGMGCAMLHSKWEDHETRKEALRLLENCYKQGIRYFDTSSDYGDSERVLGEFFKESLGKSGRQSFFIATKAPYFFQKGKEAAFEEFKRTFYEGFERLRLDVVDLFQVHDTEAYAVCADTVLPFLEERRREGMIRYIGLGTRSLVAHSRAILSGAIDSSLSYYEYNLLGTAAKPLQRLAKEHGTALINGSTLMPGFLVTYDGKLVDCEGLSETASSWVLRERYGKMVKLQNLCRQLHVDILSAAFQYSLLEENIDLTLVGISSERELAAYLKNLAQPLYPEQWAAIKRLQQQDPCLEIPEEYIYYSYL